MTRILGLLVLAAGCSHGFDRGRIRERLAGEERQVDDDDIRAALAAKPQLRFPIKVGIVFLDDEPAARWDPRAAHFRWRDGDREAMVAGLAKLRADGIVSDFFLVPADLTGGKDLKHLRLAAAKYGADAVLVVKGAAETERYSNPLSVLYLTIVGGFLVPATHSDALFAARCALWDVGNEFLYLSAESEGTSQRLGPAFILEDGPALEAAKEDALRGIDAELLRRFAALAGS